MPLPVIDNIYRCVFNWTGTHSSEGSVVSVQHFRTLLEHSELAAVLDDTVDHMFEGLADETVCDQVTITRLDGESGAQTFTMENWRGESGSGVVPTPGLNILVEGSTAFRGSANRGRLFLPSVVEEVYQNGILLDANREELDDAWNSWMSSVLVSHSVHWGVASYVSREDPPAEPHFNDYQSVHVPAMLGMIRRRRNRGSGTP